MAAGLRNRGFLDPKKCWKDWHINFGSLAAVVEEHIRTGRFNPRTDRPPTKSAIEKSAFSWAIHNPEEAKKDLAEAWLKEGVILADEEFKRLLVRWAKLVYRTSPRTLSKFLAQSGLKDYA